MKNKIMLISQLYNESRYSGGNRVHNTIIETFNNNASGTIVLLNFSDISNFNFNCINLTIKKTFDLYVYLNKVRKIVANHDYFIVDGIVSCLLFLLLFPFVKKKSQVLIVHHNVEARLNRGVISKFLFCIVQNLVSKLASKNIFLSEDDLNNFSHSNNSISCIPLSYKDVLEYNNAFKLNLTSDVVSKFNNYIAIPSNLNYQPNVVGLIKFYNERRFFFKDFKIIISTPNIITIPENLKKFTEKYSDYICSFDKYSEYLSFIKNSICVLLPIYEGSGIQLKAIDSFFLNSNVIATNFIVNSSKLFKNFKSFDDSNFNYSSQDLSKSDNHFPAIEKSNLIDSIIIDFIHEV